MRSARLTSGGAGSQRRPRHEWMGGTPNDVGFVAGENVGRAGRRTSADHPAGGTRRCVAGAERRVGIPGSGERGQDAGPKLKTWGFNVVLLSRSERTVEGLTSCAGAAPMPDLLG